MIKKASECSIRTFMRCLFEQDYTDVENFDNIHQEYIDSSGESRWLDLQKTIHNMNVRVHVVPAMIQFQLNYFKQYKEPYWDGFNFFEKYGYKLTWDPKNSAQFFSQLERIETEEKKYESRLNRLKQDFESMQKSGRQEFINLFNNIRESKNIEMDHTDIGSFALMVKEYFENL